MDEAKLLELLGRGIATGDRAAAAAGVLERAEVGFLGMPGDGWAYVVPLSFACVDGTVCFHGGGRLKASLLESESLVCLAVLADPELRRSGDDPCADDFTFESVLAFGVPRLVVEEGKRESALRAIVEKYHPEAAQTPFQADVLARTRVYAMEPLALTYKACSRT
jgi:nitroimidazol reductase NimA-like FMN-containing flavoprotein (pyridoxamine 5'-phosphate oxidase superfamily)